jgi:hypothetical protein
VKYYAATKKKETMFAVEWMELEIIMLRELSQTLKAKVTYVEVRPKS